MDKFPGSIKVGITGADGKEWFATSLMAKSTPEKTVAYLNKLSKERNLGSTYRLATEAEYMAYRAIDIRI